MWISNKFKDNKEFKINEDTLLRLIVWDIIERKADSIKSSDSDSK